MRCTPSNYTTERDTSHRVIPGRGQGRREEKRRDADARVCACIHRLCLYPIPALTNMSDTLRSVTTASSPHHRGTGVGPSSPPVMNMSLGRGRETALSTTPRCEGLHGRSPPWRISGCTLDGRVCVYPSPFDQAGGEGLKCCAPDRRDHAPSLDSDRQGRTPGQVTTTTTLVHRPPPPRPGRKEGKWNSMKNACLSAVISFPILTLARTYARQLSRRLSRQHATEPPPHVYTQHSFSAPRVSPLRTERVISRS